MKITNEEFEYMNTQVKKFKDVGYQIKHIEKNGKEISIVLIPIILSESNEGVMDVRIISLQINYHVNLRNYQKLMGHWIDTLNNYRSEERRVGKECRSRW